MLHTHTHIYIYTQGPLSTPTKTLESNNGDVRTTYANYQSSSNLVLVGFYKEKRKTNTTKPHYTLGGRFLPALDSKGVGALEI